MLSTIPSTKSIPDSAERDGQTQTGVWSRLSAVLTSAHANDESRRRSAYRYRRVALTAFTSLFSKMFAFLSAILVVPITFRYLGVERYGLWMTITSFVLFLGFADLGIGNGLAAALATADGRDDSPRAARLVSCAFYCLLPSSLVLLCASCLVTRLLPWQSIYGLQSSLYVREAGIATLILAACSLLNMPLGTVLRVQIGYQQGYLADLWNALGSALGLAALLAVVHFSGGLPLLVAAFAGAPLVITAVNWATQFLWVRPALRPRIALFDATIARQLLAVGGIFFLQQCFGLIYYTTDNLVIARTMGAVHVANYAVLQRIFSLGLVTQYLVTPLWPAIGEALARRDFAWAHNAARKALLGSVALSSFSAVLLLLCSRVLVRRWSGTDPGPIDSLRLGFALWVVLAGYIATMNALLNHHHLIRKHVAIFGAASVCSLLLKVGLARHGSLTGVIWSTVIGFGLIYVVPTLFLMTRGLRPLVTPEIA